MALKFSQCYQFSSYGSLQTVMIDLINNPSLHLAYLYFNSIIEFFGQFTIYCINYYIIIIILYKVHFQSKKYANFGSGAVPP